MIDNMLVDGSANEFIIAPKIDELSAVWDGFRTVHGSDA